MLAEKLLLQLLIVLAPVLLCSSLFDHKKKWNIPIISGIMHSLAAIACIIFNYSNYGIIWDLRYAPLILAILYAGPAAGGMVITSIIGARLIMGGGTVYFAIVGCLLTAIVPFLLRKCYWNTSSNRRVRFTLLSGGWSIVLCYLSLLTYHYLNGNTFKIFINIPDLLLFALIYTGSLTLAAKLYEGQIEKAKMKEEILKAEKLNTLSELAASIAHEVRNPLTVVKGFLQLMQQDEKGKNYEYFGLVLSELGRAEAIISDYLNFAKPKFEKLEEFALKDILKEIVMLLEPYAVKQGVRLESELDTSDFCLYTDRNQLKQALVNLVKNAIEATSEEGVVTIHTKSDRTHGSVLITDNGKGMTPEQLSRIGTLFYTTKDKGTGLGTSVSLRIIETIKGRVFYQSETGLGTTVTIVLPGGKKEELVSSINNEEPTVVKIM
ncbi:MULTISPECIES: ATP-binding protein [Neobacillus]|uniref:histidine kinase n=1 Tax=Neobacillus rhizophilus TaxID=2833579 RepID=A0A942YV05_9BACI|nr:MULTISPECIES: ATP-binding protein [Neobacillus]MBS4213659.1 ATP-binding protein [Neobacillus rhizophilus]